MRDFGKVVSDEELERTRFLLKDKLLNSSEASMEFLKSNATAVLVLESVLRDIAEHEVTPEFMKFKEKYEKLIESIPGIDHILEHYGATFTLQILIESWERKFGKNDLLIYQKTFRSFLDQIVGRIDTNDDSRDSRILQKMFEIFDTRVLEIQHYELKKFNERWKSFEFYAKKLIDEILNMSMSSNEIGDELQVLLTLSSMSSIIAEEFRKNLAHILKQELEQKFASMDEDLKYRIAPWLKGLGGSSEYIAHLTDPSSPSENDDDDNH